MSLPGVSSRAQAAKSEMVDDIQFKRHALRRSLRTSQNNAIRDPNVTPMMIAALRTALWHLCLGYVLCMYIYI